MDWFQTLRDSMSKRMFSEARALARFEWDPDESSRPIGVISGEDRAGGETLLALPDWEEMGLPART